MVRNISRVLLDSEGLFISTKGDELMFMKERLKVYGSAINVERV